MTPSFPEIINSRLFKFIVGETIDGSPTEFLIYEEAVARLSKPLHTLIKGDLSEAQAGCTIWKEVDKETFERFVQFAYTGDYSIPDTREWNKVAEPQKGETDALVESKLDELQTSSTTSKRSKKEKKKGKDAGLSFGSWGMDPSEPMAEPEPEPESWLESTTVSRTRRTLPWLSTTDFRSLQCPLLAPRNIHDHTCEPAGHFEPNRSYSNVFLSHASLYVLGDLWLIDELKALAIYKLHKTLCVLELDGKNVADIVHLARYAYEEGGTGSEDGIGRLRSIVCQYVAFHAAVLSLHAEFMDLITEGGEFVRDFVKFAVQRMQ